MSGSDSDKSAQLNPGTNAASTPRSRSSSERLMSLPQLLLLAVILNALYLLRQAQRPHLTMSPTPTQLKIGTFNIRYDGRASQPVPISGGRPAWEGPPSRGTKWGERPWAERRWSVADQVIWEDLDLVGFQEVLTNQLADLRELLGPGYGWEGVGRDDGKKAGEYVPIAFKKSIFSLESVEHFWLSTTPRVPGSISWDAGQTRMATLLHLAFLSPPSPQHTSLYVLNTHWDDRGVQARAESATVILNRVASLRDEGKLVVLLGDLNSPSREEGYQRLTGNKYRAMPEREGAFVDTARELEVVRPRGVQGEKALLHGNYGARNTYTGFSATDRADVIDVVLVLDNGLVRTPSRPHKSAEQPGLKWRVLRAGVVPNTFDDGRGGYMSSDHRLTIAALELVV